MILWTIQPLHIWQQVENDGIYTCDPGLFSMPEFKTQYEWLAKEMSARIGPPPKAVKYPVWAWYMQEGKRDKPDLRKARWSYGPGDEDYICIELDVPDEEVVLSDFDLWSIVLLHALISENEEDAAILESCYESLPANQKEEYKRKNWDQIFEIKPFHNEWITRGEWVQATFWQLKKEYVRNVVHFRTAKRHKAP